MRCRAHPSEPGGGVCAYCLNDRLSALTAAPAEHDATPSPAILQKPDLSTAPPALLCSRSAFSIVSDKSQAAQGSCGGRQKRCAVKLSLLSPIWGSLSPKKAESDAIVLKPAVSSRFLALVLRQWKKNKKKLPHISPAVEDVNRGRSREPHVPPVNGRGMSPTLKDETEEDERCLFTPRRKAQRQHSPHKLSSYVLCLSPMLRPSPGNRRNHSPLETMFAGDLRGTFNRRLSGVAVAVSDASSSLLPNRSRKLVDLGKAW